ncbi:MAG: hypothetical protein UW60_C0055G0002 [Candidatus Woesebacteria bacterium GW2011_GWA2_44_33]|uniref:Uncharacterized protein n=1 Tax=Candidatus Woesebacteria bacterium GW2011_GWA2_44_33 TaxID=1618564 RepID=A0A0G1IZY4_9BACT|nr:MAG: hypothetical protein UW60_C0055G0002 [Candidatus Woesebacteria bacterium GW2011_GWA2_44_33]
MEILEFSSFGTLPVIDIGGVALHADDRFDAFFQASFIKLDHSVHGSVVGNGNGVHPVFLNVVKKLVYF